MDLERVGKYWPETLSIVRIVVGLLFLEHGSAKLLGFLTPPNPAPAMMTLLWTQGVIELAGGCCLQSDFLPDLFGGRYGRGSFYGSRP